MTDTLPGAFPDSPALDLDSEQLARDYDAISATRQLLAGKHLAADLALRPGERVLDLGCGTGLLAEHLADLVGPTGFVTGLDPLPLRIELAKTRARPNLAFEVGDAYALEALASEAFDAIVLNAVFHWLPEKTGPMQSFARILRKGGRLGISTTLKGVSTIVQQLVRQALAEPPFAQYVRPREGISYRVDIDEMRALFEAAGFEASRIEVVASEQRFATADEAIQFGEASSFGNLLGHLPPELKPLARERLAARLADFMGPQGFVQQRQRLVAVGTKR